MQFDRESGFTRARSGWVGTRHPPSVPRSRIIGWSRKLPLSIQFPARTEVFVAPGLSSRPGASRESPDDIGQAG